jgi:hypothetical protein
MDDPVVWTLIGLLGAFGASLARLPRMEGRSA